MILVILGASCSGKTELMAECVRQGCHKIRTNTTRGRRANEPKDAYNFITRERFEELLRADELVEHAVYSGEYYGVGKKDAEVGGVVIVEPDGFRNLTRLYGDGVYSVYFNVPEDVRMERGLLRGDSMESIKRRIAGDREVFDSGLFDEVNLVLNSPKREEYPIIAALCRAVFQHK